MLNTTSHILPAMAKRGVSNEIIVVGANGTYWSLRIRARSSYSGERDDTSSLLASTLEAACGAGCGESSVIHTVHPWKWRLLTRSACSRTKYLNIVN